MSILSSTKTGRSHTHLTVDLLKSYGFRKYGPYTNILFKDRTNFIKICYFTDDTKYKHFPICVLHTADVNFKYITLLLTLADYDLYNDYIKNNNMESWKKLKQQNGFVQPEFSFKENQDFHDGYIPNSIYNKVKEIIYKRL